MIRAISSDDLLAIIDRGGTDEALPDGRVRIFDLRDAVRFRDAHVAGARHVPKDQALRWIPQWVEPYELVVLIDEDGRQGGDARHVAVELVHQWFRRVRYLDGGMERWSSEARPVESGGPAGEAAASSCGMRVDYHLSAPVPWSTSKKALPPDPARVKYRSPDDESLTG